MLKCQQIRLTAQTSFVNDKGEPKAKLCYHHVDTLYIVPLKLVRITIYNGYESSDPLLQC